MDNLGDVRYFSEAGPVEQSSVCTSLLGPVHQESVAKLPKFVEGILVGGNILMIIFSGCGNVAALIIVIRSKAPRLSTKYFLTFLASSDLLLTLVAPPTSIAKMMNDYNAWIFGSVLCKMVPSLQLVAATMSATCLMAIAVERNMLVVQAMKSSSKLTATWNKWIVPVVYVAIIIVPIACGLPLLWSYQHVSFVPVPRPPPSSKNNTSTTTLPASSTTTVADDTIMTTESTTTELSEPTNHSCSLRYYCMRTTFDRRNILYFSITGANYFCLFTCFLVCYVSIFLFVKKHGNLRKVMAEHQNSKLLTAEKHKKTMRLVLGLILLNFCFRFPNWVYLVYINVVVTPSNELTLTLLESLHFLSTANSALNPFLYVIWNHSLRSDPEAGNNAGGGAGADFGTGGKRRNQPLKRICSRWRDLFYSLCSCFRYKRENLARHNHGLTSSSLKVFNIKPVNSDAIASASTQPVCYSDTMG